jgi:hypothetical protein
MRASRSITNLLIAAVLLLLPAAALPANLLHYQLHSLDTAANVDLQQHAGKPGVFILFEPGCAWCLKQVRVLNRMLESCDSLQALAVGINGDRRGYLDTLAKLHPQFPAYEISKEMLDDLGGSKAIPATPTMLYVDAGGEFVTWSVGYLKEEMLQATLEQYLPDTCAALP